jgi:PAS domain-containing protein
MDLKRLFLKLILSLAVLGTVWTAFSGSDWKSIAEEAEVDLGKYSEIFARWTKSKRFPPRFQKVLVLFAADTTKEDRDAFLAGLEDVRIRHLKDYRETFRKWEESWIAEHEKEDAEVAGERFVPELEFERDFYHNPYFLKLVDVRMIRTEKETAYLDNNPYPAPFHLWDLDSLDWNLAAKHLGKGVALIVAASDTIAAEVTRKIREGTGFLSVRDDTVVLFAGVSSFDESIRERQMVGDDVIELARAPYTFDIKHTPDPWPNTELALSVFPKTKKVILLTPPLSSQSLVADESARTEKLWNEEKETAFRAKLGPGKTLKTIPMSVIDEGGRTEADIATIKNMFAASVKAEIQPDTVIVSMSSIEHGQDPVSWLPDDFATCPVFADTPPTRKNAVGGFCRSMKKLAVQVGDLLEELGKAPLEESRKGIPATIPESDDLWINEAALKRYGLNLADFPENVIVANTTTKKAPRMRVYPTWTKKRIFALLAANAAVLGGLALITLLSIRARRRRRNLSEKVYESLPVRVLVTDREGRIIDYHMQYGEMTQTGEIPWRNINSVPWLQDIDAGKAVREAFDTGRTIVREYEIDGERRVVVLSSTPSEVFGRAAVVAVSSDSPHHKPQT